ncbi:hypothetical protein BJY52DRAFT_767203 [Lactarius psammicola]|nr:hypothetical protein BJY52DRAFT_767203 [Lactarius psammicola]
MFKKPLADIKTSAPLRSSDRRKLRARTTERFQLAPEIADTLVPDGLLVQKFSAYNSESGVLYISGDGDPLWFSVGKGSGSSFDELIPTVYTLWKHPMLLPVLTTPAAVIPILVGGADLMVPGVVQAPAHASAGTLIGVAQFVRDVRGPPLAVGRMAVDVDKIDNGVTQGKAVVVLHTWKDHLWALGSKGGPPDALPVVAAAAVDEGTGGADTGGDGADGDGGSADAPRPSAGQENAVNAPAVTQDSTTEVEEIEKLTPEEVSTRLRAALLQALQTTLAALPNSAFPMPTTTLYTVHILPARPFSRTTTTPVDIKHSAFKSLSAFLRASEKGGLLKLKDARPDVQVSAVFPTHADVIAHQPHRTVGEEDEHRRRVEEREAQQAAAAANAEKVMTVTERWKPHLGTLPLFEDLGLDTEASYSLADVKSALFTYVEKHDLVNRFEQQYINVSSDAVFSAALFGSPNTKGTTPAPEFVKRETALKALCKHMQPWYHIAVPGNELITKKGTLRPIAVTAKARQGRSGKACTHITGFEPFQLSADALADALRVRCASSTSVSLMAGGGQEVMVQGRQTQVVLELLDSLGVPKKWIEATGLKDKKK